MKNIIEKIARFPFVVIFIAIASVTSLVTIAFLVPVLFIERVLATAAFSKDHPVRKWLDSLGKEGA